MVAKVMQPGKRGLGIASAALGLLAVAGTALIAVVSTTAFTPGDAVVIPAALIGFASLIGSAILGFAALNSEGRKWAIVGLSLSAIVVVGFVVLLNSVEY